MSTAQVILTVTCDDLTQEERDRLPDHLMADFIRRNATTAEMAAVLVADAIGEMEYNGSILGDDVWELLGHPVISATPPDF